MSMALMKGSTIPGQDQLLCALKLNMNEAATTIDLRHLEVIAGSYLFVAGAVLGLIRLGRMSFFGLTLLTLVIWGMCKETFVGKNAMGRFDEACCLYPVMTFVIVIMFCSIRRDVRRLIRSSKSKKIGKCLRTHSKVKHK